MNQRIAVNDLSDSIGSPVGLLVGVGSFESRCLTIPEALGKHSNKMLFFRNKQSSEEASSNWNKLSKIAEQKISIMIELDLDDPIATADAMQDSLVHLDEKTETPVFIDITTFTHEHLLIFLRVLSEARINRRIIFGYTGAEQYSINTLPEDVWLSKGVSHIRSVLGFPGEILPSKKLHLILLIGFEHERAKAVIEQFEPSILTLGVGEVSESVSEAHYANNQRFFDDVKLFVDNRTRMYSSIKTFSFSCVDPLATRNSILAQIENHSSHNTVVCPMNTKISTLGVGLAALRDRRIQVCYSRAITYNEKGYSTPSTHVTTFECNFADDRNPSDL